MPANDLHEPLGMDGSRSGRARRVRNWGLIACTGLGGLLAGLVAFSFATDNGMGGRPFAEAAIQPGRVDEAPAAPPSAPPPEQAASVGAASQSTAAIIDATTGVRVVRQSVDRSPGGPLILKVPQERLGLQLAPAPDTRLVEKGRHGPVPRIGADGSRPSEIYARPFVAASNIKAGAPRIAIVVGGMGLNAAATTTAVDLLPGEITLGFAPYGADLDRQVARAREAGHEILLQAPMEPLEKADIPGPNTLLSGVDPSQNIDALRWLMSRMTGYVGVANFLGSRFMAREADLAPVLREIAARGLLFLDDGTAMQSLAPSLAAAAGMQTARADVALDASPGREAVELALGRLEAVARAKGFAIGYAAGLPGSLEPIARYAQGLEKRGVALAPLSALAGRSAPSAGLAR